MPVLVGLVGDLPAHYEFKAETRAVASVVVGKTESGPVPLQPVRPTPVGPRPVPPGPR